MSDEKKIIIDEDWKSQVESEREAASKEQESKATSPEQPSTPLPPPSLTFLAGTLYLQGVVSLGVLPSPTSDKPEVHLEQAKHAIDTLEMLHKKTEGNRTPEETKEMDTMLHELRLAYVGMEKDSI